MTQSGPRAPPTCGDAPRAPTAGASRIRRTPPSTRCTHRTWLRCTRCTLTSTPSRVPTTTGTCSTWATRAWRTLRYSQSLCRGTTSPWGPRGYQAARLLTSHPSSAVPHCPPSPTWILWAAPAPSPAAGASEVEPEGSAGARLQG